MVWLIIAVPRFEMLTFGRAAPPSCPTPYCPLENSPLPPRKFPSPAPSNRGARGSPISCRKTASEFSNFRASKRGGEREGDGGKNGGQGTDKIFAGSEMKIIRPAMS